MMVDYDLTAVIPARLGSSRVSEKVFCTIDSKDSLLSRKVHQLRRILPRDRVVVNTESEKIADQALQSGASVHWRDEYYSDGTKASFSELIIHVVSQVESEHIAWTPFVVPFFDEFQFKEAFKNYNRQVIEGDYDSLVSVVPLKEYIWDEKRALNYSANHNHTISQHLPNWFQVTNGNYMAPKDLMIRTKYILGKKVYLDQRAEFCKIDIDTLDDLEIAKAYQTAHNRQ